MNLKATFCLLFVLHVTSAYRVLQAFSTEIDFGSYINKSEKDLVDDVNVNWVRTDYANAYVCQGQVIKKESDLLKLLPKSGKFMATYIYARPKFGQTLVGELITYPLTLPTTTNGFVDFTFSQDSKTTLRLYLWRKNEGKKNMQLIWQNEARSGSTNGIVSARASFTNSNDEFRLVFSAQVSYEYPYSFRTYLSQVIVDRVVISTN